MMGRHRDRALPGTARDAPTAGTVPRIGLAGFFLEADRFAALLKMWVDTVKRPARAAFAQQLLPLFDGRDTVTVRGKAMPDPVCAELRRIAEAK